VVDVELCYKPGSYHTQEEATVSLTSPTAGTYEYTCMGRVGWAEACWVWVAVVVFCGRSVISLRQPALPQFGSWLQDVRHGRVEMAFAR
jgi:hypothetical protein